MSPNNMQETKECCGKCQGRYAFGLVHQDYCRNKQCACHNSSYRNKKVAEALVDLAAESRKQGANEFKQRVLEALPMHPLNEAAISRGQFINRTRDEIDTYIEKTRTIISNLEV